MKVTLEADALKPALKRARAVIGRTQIPILGTVRLATDGDVQQHTLGLTATNIDITIAADVAAGITTGGGACIDATMLAAAVATAPSGGQIETTTAKLTRALVTIRGAIATDETRYYLCGVFWHCVDGHLVTAATDGHTLSRIETGMVWSEGAPMS